MLLLLLLLLLFDLWLQRRALLLLLVVLFTACVECCCQSPNIERCLQVPLQVPGVGQASNRIRILCLEVGQDLGQEEEAAQGSRQAIAKVQRLH
jgi:hypothetical protein